MNSLDCKLRDAECEKLAEGALNPRVQATLRDMARTWTRLALEAEQTLKQSRPPLQLIYPNPLQPPASPQEPSTVTLGSRHRNGQRLSAFYVCSMRICRAALPVRSCAVAAPTGLCLGRPMCMLENDTQGRVFDRAVPEHPRLDPDDHSN
jgi:hypothetical protein